MPSVAEAILAKTPLPTHLDSATIRARVAADIRQRAFFSARMTSLTYLKQLQTIVGAFAEGKINAADARLRCQQALGALGLDNGGHNLTDHGSARRLNLIIDTQRRMGSAMAQVDLSKDPEILEAFPAWELRSGGYRRVHRTDWLDRWHAAGEACGWMGACRDRMVALKTSPIWKHLGQGAGGFKDTLGNPFPPFAFGSSYVWLDVSLPKAIRYGLIEAPSALNKRDTHGHFAKTEGEACTHEQGVPKAWLEKPPKGTPYEALKCSRAAGEAFFRANPETKDSNGKRIKLPERLADKYLYGKDRPQGPDPSRLTTVRLALLTTTNPERKFAYEAGQTVYYREFGKRAVAVFVLSNGEVNGILPRTIREVRQSIGEKYFKKRK